MRVRLNVVLTAVVVVGILFSVLLNLDRHKIEQNNDSVEMAMEYEGLLKLAALEGLSEKTVLEDFKKAGINSLMVFDTTLERLGKKNVVKVATGGELRQAAALTSNLGVFNAVVANGLLEENAVYVAAGENKEAFSHVREDLTLRYGMSRVSAVTEDGSVIKVLGKTEMLPEDKFDEPLGILQAPLGLSADDLKSVAAGGFNVIVRPQNYVSADEGKINSIFKRIADSGVKVHAYMPAGREVVGYPDKIDYMGKSMRAADMSLIMLEHYTQLRFAQIDGLIPLAESLDYKAARAYVIDPLEQKKISVDTALHRWALTDEERNIRVNYIRPFLIPKDGKPILETNLKYVEDISAAVKDRGYSIGKSGVFSSVNNAYEPYFPEKWKLVPVAAAIIAAMIMYIALLFEVNFGRQMWLWLILTAGVTTLLLLGRGLLTRQLLALIAASVFPVLSMHCIMSFWDKNTQSGDNLVQIIWRGIWQLAFAVILSLTGALLLSAVLTDSRFLLEIDIYRGVKITFILPVFLTALLYIKKYDLLRISGKKFFAAAGKIGKLLDGNLTFKHILYLVIFLVVAFYFVGRSGHTGGVPVPAIELKLRALLEQLMYARPREKEFLIGHPAFFLAVFAAYRKAPRLLQFVLVSIAVIGQGSLVQTFCHMRTPVFMSLIRAFDGYAVGVVLGTIGVICVALALPLYRKIRRDLSNE